MVLRCGGPGLIKEIISKTYTFGGDILEIKPLKFSLEDYLIESLEETSGGDKALSGESEEMIHAHTH